MSIEEKKKIAKTIEKIYLIAFLLYISLTWMLVKVWHFNIEWSVFDNILIGIIVVYGIFECCFWNSIYKAQKRLKEKLTVSDFKKVKIDFDNTLLSETILKCNNIETFASRTVNGIIITVVFEGFDEEGNLNKVSRTYQFDENKIQFLEVED